MPRSVREITDDLERIDAILRKDGSETQYRLSLERVITLSQLVAELRDIDGPK